MGWDGVGWEPLLLNSYPSSFSRNSVVRVSSGWCARQRVGMESLELVPRPLLPPVCDFPGVVITARVLGWQVCACSCVGDLCSSASLHLKKKPKQTYRWLWLTKH